ncbi:D-lactaldehyde dehydrogenase [Panus rudis PR-1116 ss-1]|nr:D-lactaldehyde dehydrogenase [Panus rudis PR-1116 ss-1]
MTTVPSGKVLVTGANGYIATWIVHFLLEQGYYVRGTVRSEDKARSVLELFPAYKDKLEFSIVKDITKERAFDDAVKGVDAVIHTASPVVWSETAEPEEIIKPAVQGILDLFESVQEYGDKVRRIIQISSAGAVEELTSPPRTYSEKDWNFAAVREVEQKGAKASPVLKYAASKVLAEQAAWKYYREKKEKGEIRWDFTVLIPPVVFGPLRHHVRDPSRLPMPMDEYYAYVLHGKAGPNTATLDGNCWVDVRDVALAHVVALRKSGSGGQRLIVSAGQYCWRDWVAAAQKIAPNVHEKRLPPAKPKNEIQKFDASTTSEVLGIKYHTLDETTRAILDSFENLGLWRRN